MGENEMDDYDTALICLNGHVINSAMKKYPAINSDYCKDCGAKTVSKCDKCGVGIRGRLAGSYIYIHGYDIPRYCHSCGKPYPWTEASIQAFTELSEMVEQLSPEEKELLSNSVGDLIADTPRTQLAVFNITRMGKKLSEETRRMMRGIIDRTVTESVKKQLAYK